MFDRKTKSNSVADQRDRAEQRCRSRYCPPSWRDGISTCQDCGLPRRSQAPIAAVTTSPTTGTRPMITSRPIRRLVPGHGERALEQDFHRVDPAADRGGIAADRQPLARRLRNGCGSIGHGQSAPRAISSPAGWRANRLGRKPVSRGETSDQRTGVVDRDEGVRPASSPVGDGELGLALGRRSAPGARPPAPASASAIADRRWPRR